MDDLTLFWGALVGSLLMGTGVVGVFCYYVWRQHRRPGPSVTDRLWTDIIKK